MSQVDGAYAALTEAPGGRVSAEGEDMLRTRYAFGAEVGAGGRILEVGCGPGVGLGLLASRSSFVVGGDYDSVLLQHARRTYSDRIPLVRLDVQALPFADGAFDTVLFFEGSYYIPDVDRGFDEMARVVGPGGRLVFVNANPERPDFIPSPLSVKYHSAAEFRTALERRGFRVSLEGAYPLHQGGLRSRLMIWARMLASRLGFIPGTLAGRALLKRLIVGQLVSVPAELGPPGGYETARVQLAEHDAADGYKVRFPNRICG